METGGFKGRSRAVSRDDLYARLEARLGIPCDSIVAEYGMTELLSQFYDDAASRTSSLRIARYLEHFSPATQPEP